MNVWFKNWRCTTVWGFYGNGRIGLRLVEGSSPVATATVNTAIDVGLDQIVVKEYGENEGLIEALIEAGVIEPAFEAVYIGHFDARCARCRLTPTALAEACGLPPPASPSAPDRNELRDR
ncbi:MAG: hypothetical protein VX836_01465 [Pseudomonadota bacterium]|nr:hypothetical protein [Pseudomonadota bacterium]